MKVIDLLNKIANGEEVPERIEFDNKIYDYVKMWQQYVDDKEKPLLKYISEFNYSGLNDEVSIVEESQDIDIQSIKEWENKSTINDLHDVENEIRFLWMGYNNLLKIGKQLDRQINNN